PPPAEGGPRRFGGRGVPLFSARDGSIFATHRKRPRRGALNQQDPAYRKRCYARRPRPSPSDVLPPASRRNSHLSIVPIALFPMPVLFRIAVLLTLGLVSALPLRAQVARPASS